MKKRPSIHKVLIMGIIDILCAVGIMIFVFNDPDETFFGLILMFLFCLILFAFGILILYKYFQLIKMAKEEDENQNDLPNNKTMDE